MVYVQKRTFTQCLKEAKLIILAMWMRLKDVVLSETSQPANYCMVHLH